MLIKHRMIYQVQGSGLQQKRAKNGPLGLELAAVGRGDPALKSGTTSLHARHRLLQQQQQNSIRNREYL
jgi:hypothetical protein